MSKPMEGAGRRTLVMTALGCLLVAAFVIRVGCARERAAMHRSAIDALVCQSATGPSPMSERTFAEAVRHSLRRAPADLELRLIHAATSAPPSSPVREIPRRALTGDIRGARLTVANAAADAPDGFSAAWTHVLDRWDQQAADGCRPVRPDQPR